MPRCGDCNKFVGVDAEPEPEVDIYIDAEGMVTGTVDIENVCADCGTTLRTGHFDLELDCTAMVAAHRAGLTPKQKDKHSDLSVTDSSSRTDRFGKGQRAAHWYGAEVTVSVECECGEVLGSASWADDMKASHMDEA